MEIDLKEEENDEERWWRKTRKMPRCSIEKDECLYWPNRCKILGFSLRKEMFCPFSSVHFTELNEHSPKKKLTCTSKLLSWKVTLSLTETHLLCMSAMAKIGRTAQEFIMKNLNFAKGWPGKMLSLLICHKKKLIDKNVRSLITVLKNKCWKFTNCGLILLAIKLYKFTEINTDLWTKKREHLQQHYPV